jgi:5-methylcytosine-specific restriction endonuclease McrA
LVEATNGPSPWSIELWVEFDSAVQAEGAFWLLLTRYHTVRWQAHAEGEVEICHEVTGPVQAMRDLAQTRAIVCGGHVRLALSDAAKEARTKARLLAERDRARAVRRPQRGRPHSIVDLALVYSSRSVPPRLRAAILERDRFRCRRCGASADDERLVVDHVQPVALGGLTCGDNLQTLCVPCNQGKADRPPHSRDTVCPRERQES